MTTSVQLRAAVLGFLVALTGSVALAQNATMESARSYLQGRTSTKRSPCPCADIDALVVSSQHVSTPTGITHLYLQQQIDGIPVDNAIVNVAISRDGRVASLGNNAVSMDAMGNSAAAPSLTAEAACSRLPPVRSTSTSPSPFKRWRSARSSRGRSRGSV